MKLKLSILVGVLVVAAGIGGWLLWSKKGSTPPAPVFARTSADLLAVVDKSKMTCLDSLPEEAMNSHLAQLEDFRKYLVDNPNHAPTWRNLAGELKFFCDYEGAAIALEKSVELNPIGDIAMHNLGDLYENFLNNYPRAELMYQKAITANSKSFFDHIALANLYRYKLKEKAGQIETVILNGVSSDSENAADYYKFLVEYFTDEGNAEKTAEYQKLLEAAGG